VIIFQHFINCFYVTVEFFLGDVAVRGKRRHRVEMRIRNRFGSRGIFFFLVLGIFAGGENGEREAKTQNKEQ
jgi:hypothetical protein